ncbi:hypothetical protein E2C01_035267 [Portunus trituberculatus]|uniref:Uncharacterized protein n=1 Tax=Portunus trituberculatus TaxID=210409 RepID=A0A5B7F809_PORTR|nr:hypothetical protein [Portunus trituberculatus]
MIVISGRILAWGVLRASEVASVQGASGGCSRRATLLQEAGFLDPRESRAKASTRWTLWGDFLLTLCTLCPAGEGQDGRGKD